MTMHLKEKRWSLTKEEEEYNSKNLSIGGKIEWRVNYPMFNPNLKGEFLFSPAGSCGIKRKNLELEKTWIL